MVAFLSPRGGRPLSVLMEEIKLYAGMDSLRNAVASAIPPEGARMAVGPESTGGGLFYFRP